MICKKLKNGGVISRIKGNRRVKKQRKLIKKNTPSKNSATESLGRSATPATPRAEVRRGRLKEGIKLRAPVNRGVSVPSGRRATSVARRKIGSDPAGVVARERASMQSRMRQDSSNRRRVADRSGREPAKGTPKPTKKTNFGTPAYRSIDDMKRSGFQSIGSNARKKRNK